MSRKEKQNRIEMLGRVLDRLKRLHRWMESESECVAVSDCDCGLSNDFREFDGMLAVATLDFDDEGEEPVDEEEDGPAAPPTENSPLTQRTLLVAFGKVIAEATAAAGAAAIRRRRGRPSRGSA